MKGLIFDYGGTIDTNGCHWGKMIWHAYERAGVPIDENDFREAYKYAERTLGTTPIIQPDYTFKRTLGMKLRIELEFIEQKYNINNAVDKYSKSILDDLYKRTVDTTEESKKTLENLSVKYPMALVSNFYGNLNVVLREFGLDKVFKHVIESAVVGVRKPDPRIFRLGVEALGLNSSEVLTIGDSIDKDIKPAHEVGCKTVWLQGEPWMDTPVDGSIADKTIHSFNELNDILL